MREQPPKTIDVVVGGQYGSEGKGAVAGALVDRQPYDRLVRVAGPNAGHTTLTKEGAAVALRCIPAACVRDHKAALYLGAGSEIELDVLLREVNLLEGMGIPVRDRLYVHWQATLLTERHHEQEASASHGASGSTRKGVGAARAERAMRKAPLIDSIDNILEKEGIAVYDHLPSAGRTMIEGTQGYWLGLHAGLYPHCTSSDCRAIDFLAMAGAVDYDAVNVYVLFRSYPIRIAGTSGDMFQETTWDELSARTNGYIQPEITTVTKVIRRVAEFDPSMLPAAMLNNRVGNSAKVMPVLTFADYWDPSLAGRNGTFNRERSMSHDMNQLIDKNFGIFAEDIVYAGTGRDTGMWFES